MRCYTAITKEQFNDLKGGGTIFNTNATTTRRDKDGKWISNKLGEAWNQLEIEEPPYMVYIGACEDEKEMLPYDVVTGYHHWLRWLNADIIIEMDVPEEDVLLPETKYGYISEAYLEKIVFNYLISAYDVTYNKEDDTTDIRPIWLRKRYFDRVFTQYTVQIPRIGGLNATEFYKVGGWGSCDPNRTLEDNARRLSNDAHAKLMEQLGMYELSKERRKELWSIIKDKPYKELKL
jgi:hypothetical protein